MDEKLKYVLILAFVLNCAFALSNFQNRTYDSFEHIFFANHYRTSWFDTWEAKWSGGFTVTSYPPLAHQTVALLSFVIGLEWSYKVITLALMTIFPLAVYKFSKVFVKEEAALYSAFISIFLPSVFQATYSFGQLPTIFSLVSGLFTTVYLSKFLITGHRFNLLVALCLLGVSVSAHHFTAIALIPALTIILLFNILLRKEEVPLTFLLRRILVFSILGILLSLFLIYPFWYFELSNSIVMTPIMHLSRAEILFDSVGFELFFWNMYGPILFLIPFFFILAFRNRKLFPLLIGAICLFILGLGGTTPLPKMIFGQSWEILTYDRFSLWAGITLLPLCGYLFSEYYSKFKEKKIYSKIFAIFFSVLILTTVYVANRNLIVYGGNSISTVDPVIEFLNNPTVQQWRYLTVGLGEPLMLKISVYANAKNVDGYYFFVRSDPILSKSGIGTLDTAKYFGEKGLTILGEVLSNASKYSLRWVICGDPTYNKILLDSGFIQKWSQDNTGDSRLGGITIWEFREVVPEYVSNNPQEGKPQMTDYLWGIGPPLILFFAISLLFVEKKRKGDQSSCRIL